MGLAATTYLVNGGGIYELEQYVSGFLTVTFGATGDYAFSISAISGTASAQPGMVTGWQTSTVEIEGLFADQLGNPIPDGTQVEFDTSAGFFPNGQSSFTVVSDGGLAVAELTLPPMSDSAVIMVEAAGIAATTEVEVIYPDLALSVWPDPQMTYPGETVHFSYQVTNTGDVPLTDLVVVDDNGTPGQSDDDISVCEISTLAVLESQLCIREAALEQSLVYVVTVTAHDPLGGELVEQDSDEVTIISPAIQVKVVPSRLKVAYGEIITYTYGLTNTGNATITDVFLVDDNGTAGFEDDDIVVCSGMELAPQEVMQCARQAAIVGLVTVTASATGLDPLGNPVVDSGSVTVQLNLYTAFLPMVANR
jgi:hypothetical protein